MKAWITAFLVAGGAFAHDPITTNLTWTAEVSRIVYKHCAGCHRPGGRAMPLIDYEEARPWAKAIRDEVLSRRMPPWGAVKGVGDFRDDPSLSQPEIDMIVNWVEGGAPKGDDIYLPPVPEPLARSLNAASGKPVSVPATLSENVEVVAVRPGIIPENGDVEVTAVRPDGSVERMLWIRDFRRQWVRTYTYRSPVRLPRGTRITVFSSKAASVPATVFVRGPA